MTTIGLASIASGRGKPSRQVIPGLVLSFVFPNNTYIPVELWKKVKLPQGWSKLPYSPSAQLYRPWVRIKGKLGVVKDGDAEAITAMLTLLCKSRESMSAEEVRAAHRWEEHKQAAIEEGRAKRDREHEAAMKVLQTGVEDEATSLELQPAYLI